MSVYPVETGHTSVSWHSVINTTIRLLAFRASREELAALGYKHLALGLLCTWIVGMGRYWDNPRVHLLQHLGLGSVRSSSGLENYMTSEVNRVTREGLLGSRIKLYYDLDLPEIQPAPLLIALHGYGANKRQMMREALALAPAGFAVASLQGFHQHIKEPKEPGGPLRFGFGWLTNFHPEDSVAIHHQALLDLIATLTDEGIAEPGRIFLLGFSQTCALNYRFAFTHPDILRGVVGICGGIPGDWETSENYKPTKAAVFHLAGSRDEYYSPSRVADYEERLRLRATKVEFKSYDAAHEMVPAMREDVRTWLAKYSVGADAIERT